MGAINCIDGLAVGTRVSSSYQMSNHLEARWRAVEMSIGRTVVVVVAALGTRVPSRERR